MNRKLITPAVVGSLLSAIAVSYSAPLTQSDVTGWWAYAQGSMSGTQFVSTYYGNTAEDFNNSLISHPESWDVSAEGTEILGKSLNWGMTPIMVGNVANNNYMTAVSGVMHLAGIYNGPTEGEFGTYDTSSGQLWQFYDSGNGGIFTVDNITSSLNCYNNIRHNNAIIIRKRATGTNFSVAVKDIYLSNGSSLQLGEDGAGTFLTNLTLGDAESGGVINVSGLSSTSGMGRLQIRSSNITSYVSQINLSNGGVYIYNGISNDTEAFGVSNADFSSATISASGSSYFYYGDKNSPMTGNLSLGDINVTGSDSKFDLYAFTSGAVELGNIHSEGIASNFDIDDAVTSFKVGNIDFADKAYLYVGSYNSSVAGGYVDSVQLGSKINLTSSDSTSRAQAIIVAKELTFSSPVTEINLNNGYIQFLGGVYEAYVDPDNMEKTYSYDLDLSSATLTMAGNSYFNYGKQWNVAMDADISIGDIVFASADLMGAFDIYVTNGRSIEVNSISTTVKGQAGSSLFWKLNNQTVEVKNDAEIAVESMQLYGILQVDGNYLNSFEGDSFLRYQFPETGMLRVMGTFETQGTFVVGIGDQRLQTSEKNVLNLGGITGETAGSKITTAYNYEAYAGNTGASIIILSGAGSYSTSTSLVDFAPDASPAELALTGALKLSKTGSGIQYLRGSNMYRGQTTVSAGELYINADGSGNSAGWGIGAVSLSGGKFGAVGADSDIGKIVATDFVWSNNAVIAVDVAADGTCDLITLSGNFLKADGDADGKYIFDFNGAFAAEETMYKIFSWEDSSSVDFTADDFGYTYNGEVANLKGNFVVQDNNLYFVSVPEPAEYAALFGAFALALALVRRRRK